MCQERNIAHQGPDGWQVPSRSCPGHFIATRSQTGFREHAVDSAYELKRNHSTRRALVRWANHAAWVEQLCRLRANHLQICRSPFQFSSAQITWKGIRIGMLLRALESAIHTFVFQDSTFGGWQSIQETADPLVASHYFNRQKPYLIGIEAYPSRKN